MLKGEKVLLRPVKRSDIPLFLKWFNDIEVTQYLSFHMPMTEMAEEKWMEELTTTRASSTAIFVIEAISRENPLPIGNIGLDKIDFKNREALFGIAIGEKDYWSQGYGTEATRIIIKYGFERLNLHRIASAVYSFNERSLRMHKKVGFLEEGCRRKAIFQNGQYWDLIEFGILVDEWKRA